MRELSADEHLRITASHEAGHIVMTAAFGHAVSAATIAPGETYAGCVITQPRRVRKGDWEKTLYATCAPMLPASALRALNEAILVAMAGSWGPFVAPLPAPEMNTAATLAEPTRTTDLALPAPTWREQEDVDEAAKDSRYESDDVAAWRFAVNANNNDWAAARAHMEWLSEVARQMLTQRREQVERVALGLLEHTTLGSRALRRLIKGDVG